jgi:hypothetical protein
MKNRESIYSDARTEILSEYRSMCAKTPDSLIEKVAVPKDGFLNSLIPYDMSTIKNIFGAVIENEYLKQLVKSDIAKTAAQGALVGAAIAIPIPLVGPALGGALGALTTTSMYVLKGVKK